MLRYTTRPPIREPSFEMMKPAGEVHEVVIAIEEDNTVTHYPIPPPPKAYISPAQDLATPSFRLQAPTPPLAERPATPVSLVVSCPSPTISSQSRAASPTSIESSPHSHTTSPTLVRNGSTASTGTYSPVMRSMFPHFDPTVPLAQQQYYPSMDINPAMVAGSTRTDDIGSYSPSLYSQQEHSSRTLDAGFARTDGLGLKNMMKPSESSNDASSFSTPNELVALWALANGQEAPEALQKYRLELSCEDLDADEEIICFDSSTSSSLYTLSASANHLSISRNHPSNDTTTIQISTTTLQNPNASNPLIASVFPKLAELMAIDKSSTSAIQQKLDRQACTVLQTQAIEHAHNREACSLLWDSDSAKYYLIHPTLLDDDSPAAFPIEIASKANGNPVEIKILAPSSKTPIIDLSFETLCLELHTEAIKQYPNLYLLDTLLSTTLILLLHLHRSRSRSPSPSLQPTSPALPFFEPPPTGPSPFSPKRKKTRPLTSWSKSFFTRPTSQRTSKQKEDDDVESAAITVQGSPDPSLTAKLPRPPTHTFQIVDAADEKLPRTTRAVVRVLYWGFECLVWCLGVLVNILAMGVVGLGKLVKIL
ncbi:MAG: hypothetical protein Q9182_006145 [Xanthomendoza sp. 2 TL-2023]